MKRWTERITALWSTSRYERPELADYAERLLVDETRQGVMTLAFVFLVAVAGAALLWPALGLPRSYLYTSASLAALAGHVYFSARSLREIHALQALGTTLLVVSGTAFVLLAHQMSGFTAALFGSVLLLYLAVPLVPWGLREACLVTLLVYGLFSASTWTQPQRFSAETLWTLQLYMLAAASLSLTLVGRGALVRKADIRARFDLEVAHREMKRLSYRDPMTGAWNRRFLEQEFVAFAERTAKTGRPLYFGLLDVDDFKRLNDRFGHAHGDQVLRWVAQALADAIGDAGHVVRIGGDEFAVLLDVDEPVPVIEAAIETVNALAAKAGTDPSRTASVSVGLVCAAPEQKALLEHIYRQADECLYRAKRARGPLGAGGSRVITAPFRGGPESGGGACA